MEYCYLGYSGLEVARLGLGTARFGADVDEATAQRMLDLYLDAGGNLVDTANIYGGSRHENVPGTTERLVGKIIRGRRHRLVLATKGYNPMGSERWPNDVGLSRVYLTRETEASLRRLDTDYIDLYQCHTWDFRTPVEETMRVLDDFVRAGKIRYIGVSNWDGWHVLRANTFANFSGLTPLLSNQIYYTLADRTAEHSIIPACRDQKVSIIVWGALAQGFLSGRYRRGGAEPPATSHLAAARDTGWPIWKRLATEQNWAVVDALERIARRQGRTVANVAMQWLLQAGACDVVLLGPSRLEDIAGDLATIGVKLAPEETEELGRLSEPLPPYPISFYGSAVRRQ